MFLNWYTGRTGGFNWYTGKKGTFPQYTGRMAVFNWSTGKMVVFNWSTGRMVVFNGSTGRMGRFTGILGGRWVSHWYTGRTRGFPSFTPDLAFIQFSPRWSFALKLRVSAPKHNPRPRLGEWDPSSILPGRKLGGLGMAPGGVGGGRRCLKLPGLVLG